MPTTHRIGVETPANLAIGGVPTLHYLDICSQGRGQVLRLFFIDSAIAFNDVRYSEDEFATQKDGIIGQMNPVGKVPIVELNGKIFTQSYAILRYLARVLDEYDGHSTYEKYWVDAICDMAIDWRTRFVDALLSPNSEIDLAKHQQTTRKVFLAAIEKHLASNSLSTSGPFVLNERMTYADLVIYQILHDEELTKGSRQAMKEYMRLSKLVEGVEARKNIRTFLDSPEYRG